MGLPIYIERRYALWAVLLVAPIPTLGEAAAFAWWPGTAVGMAAYVACKLWILAVPAAWWLLVLRKSWSWSPIRRSRRREALLVAIGTGILIATAMLSFYALATHLHWLDAARPRMRAQAARTHLDVLWVYLLFAIVISSLNALLEEIVWRWFVLRSLRRYLRPSLAVMLSAALFTLHHTFALLHQADTFAVVLGSLGVFTGGIVLGILYRRYQSIWPGFITHIFADFGMFAIGWLMIYRT
jgi:membrane protease YdiL (CAAX protease family)